jgi:hypothetical protein
MVTKLPPLVEENINNLMDVADELVWKDAGPFDQVDSDGLRTAILNTSSKLSQQPHLLDTSHSSEHTFSLADGLHSYSSFPVSTTLGPGSLRQGKKDKVEHGLNYIKESGKGSEVPGYSRRLWKAKKAVHKMVLHSDVGLAETCSLALHGLVGRLSYRYLCNESIPKWVEHNWKRELGYTPEIRYPTKGWYGFICRSPEDSTRLLAKKWMVGRSSMMIKRWRLAFNPDIESFQMCHLWVLLPGLPLHLWNTSAREAICNSLGSFVSLDDSVMSTPSRKMGKILVEIIIHGGLPEIMEID